MEPYAVPSTPDTVFLRTLVKGDKLSLYELIDDKMHFFIQPKNDTLQELRFKRLLTDQSIGSFEDYPIYKEQLKQLVADHADNKKLLAKINGAEYRAGDITKLVVMFNGTLVNASEQQPVRKNQLFAAVGVTYSFIDYKSGFEQLSILDEDPVTGYMITTGMDFFPKRGLKTLFIRGELRFSTAGYKGEAIDEGLGYNWVHKKYELDMSLFSPTLIIGYDFWHKRNSRAYIGAGGSFNFTSYSKNRYTITDLTTKEVKTTDNFKRVENLWADALLNIGVVVNKRFETKMLYRLEGLFHHYNSVATKNSMISVLFAFRL